jgi:hypothetical protein
LEKKPQILWGVGAILVVLCCAAIVAAVVRPVLPILNDPNLTAAIDASLETPTATPMPVIERKPVTTPAAVFDPTDTIPYAPTPAEVVSPSATPEDTIVTESDPELGQASPLQLSTEQLLVQAILPERDQRVYWLCA